MEKKFRKRLTLRRQLYLQRRRNLSFRNRRKQLLHHCFRHRKKKWCYEDYVSDDNVQKYYCPKHKREYKDRDTFRHHLRTAQHGSEYKLEEMEKYRVVTTKNVNSDSKKQKLMKNATNNVIQIVLIAKALTKATTTSMTSLTTMMVTRLTTTARNNRLLRNLLLIPQRPRPFRRRRRRLEPLKSSTLHLRIVQRRRLSLVRSRLCLKLTTSHHQSIIRSLLILVCSGLSHTRLKLTLVKFRRSHRALKFLTVPRRKKMCLKKLEAQSARRRSIITTCGNFPAMDDGIGVNARL